MISQKCPKCRSKRVRRGYRPTPIWSKILFRYNLLCDNCNWEFIGFAVPGTVSAKPTKKPKKITLESKNESSKERVLDKSASVVKKNIVENFVSRENLPELIKESSESVVSNDNLTGLETNVTLKKKRSNALKKRKSGV